MALPLATRTKRKPSVERSRKSRRWIPGHSAGNPAGSAGPPPQHPRREDDLPHISDGFPGADHFLDQISIWFKKNIPSVTTVYRLKAGAFADDDPKLWAELRAKANGVIVAIGH
jgi:hypothetical protein